MTVLVVKAAATLPDVFGCSSLSTVGGLSTGGGLRRCLWSARTASVAHTFDTGLPGPEDLAGADDSLVVAAITGWACVEAAASARRLAAIAELVRRRAEGPRLRAVVV
jgi:hypothetical protein